jgi:DeoR family fructose operon transcriptional repressor
VKKYNADLAFFSCRGLSPDGWVTDISIEENRVRAAMMEQARRSVLLCASEKFNKTYLHNLCHRDALTVISDAD